MAPCNLESERVWTGCIEARWFNSTRGGGGDGPDRYVSMYCVCSSATDTLGKGNNNSWVLGERSYRMTETKVQWARSFSLSTKSCRPPADTVRQYFYVQYSQYKENDKCSLSLRVWQPLAAPGSQCLKVVRDTNNLGNSDQLVGVTSMWHRYVCIWVVKKRYRCNYRGFERLRTHYVSDCPGDLKPCGDARMCVKRVNSSSESR